MRLTNIIDKINSIKVTGRIRDEDVTGIEYDSRLVKMNSIFVAIKGFNTDGHNYIQDALSKGAIAAVLQDDNTPDDLFTHNNAAKLLVSDSRMALAEASNSYYGEPSKKINLTGITGTNGKTTTAFYLKSILENAGLKIGLIGTIENYIGSKKIESKLTTPESNDLNKLLFEMQSEGSSFAVMEVSSHSLALKRVQDIHFSSAVFTNISAEHLDFHHDFESYLKAKKILFDNLPADSFVLYNSDDIHSVDLLANCDSIKYSYGLSPDADYSISDVNSELSGTSFLINHKDKSYRVETSLVGDFNSYNACAAFAVSTLSGIDEDIAIEGIKKTPQIPGRFEVFTNGTRKVIVDYSHTPDSLEKALLVIQKITGKKSPIYTVFGCGGNRDKQKRAVMGKIATELSNKVIITSDNPRNEDPGLIINQIISGIEKDNYEVVESREDAIKKAIKGSGKGSVILIAGKGHENYQEINGVRKHFSDREIAVKYLGI